MNISCVICGDIFIGLSVNENIYATQCGHLFHYHCLIEWFERSKSCPQCRHKATEKNIIRIFFNNSSLSADTDCALLKHTVDGLEYKLKLHEVEIKKVTEERNKATAQNDGLRKEVKEMKKKVILSEQSTFSLKDEVKSLKSYCKQFSEVKLENEELKQKLTGLNSVRMILSGTFEEAECVVDNSELDPEYLRHCVKNMKRNIKKLEVEHKNTEKELLHCRRMLAERSRSFSDIKQKYESLKRLQRFDVNNSHDDSNLSNSSSHKEGSHVEQDVENAIEKQEIRKMVSKPAVQGTLGSSPLKNIQLSKPTPLYKCKPTSLIGVIQPKLQMGRIPKTSSALCASGDDVYHPNKYVGDLGKKKVKKLSASAVSGINIGAKKFKGF